MRPLMTDDEVGSVIGEEMVGPCRRRPVAELARQPSVAMQTNSPGRRTRRSTASAGAVSFGLGPDAPGSWSRKSSRTAGTHSPTSGSVLEGRRAACRCPRSARRRRGGTIDGATGAAGRYGCNQGAGLPAVLGVRKEGLYGIRAAVQRAGHVLVGSVGCGPRRWRAHSPLAQGAVDFDDAGKG